MSAELIWAPPAERRDASLLSRFAAQYRPQASSYAELHSWSLRAPGEFWSALWQFCEVRGSLTGPATQGEGMPGTRFFPEAKLNFARNLLERGHPDDVALIFRSEDGRKTVWTREELKHAAAGIARALKKAGVEPGDRVAAMLPNRPETVAAMLATTALGAVWSSCSPDFGQAALLDRFGQIAPKVLLVVSDYRYAGKPHDCRKRIGGLLKALPTLRQVYCLTDDVELPKHKLIAPWPQPDGIAGIPYRELPFDHPLYVLFSSGTTGAPKGIVHGAGGTLLQHLKEHQLQCDIQPGAPVFYYTTCGWMMWNWLATNIAWGATLLLYDGSPFYPSGEVLFTLADNEKMTLFGTSAKFIDALNKAELCPVDTHDLSSVRMLCSTGSTLVPEGFDYVYDAVKPDVHLVSFSGGTDIMGCFCGGDMTRPVWRGEIQARILGMDVQVYDDDANPMRGQKGELVCAKPFPSVPLGFLNDEGDKRFHDAYFDMFPNVWTHGDYVALTEHNGIMIFGRSDATLNPGGVRIGTAEIYRQVEKLDEIQESIVIGQDWDNDVRVVLFVILKDGITLDDDLIGRIKKQIRDNCTPRHVPAKIIPIADIPRTKSGKITELAVRDIVHGRGVKNKEALANPEALKLYEDLDALKT